MLQKPDVAWREGGHSKSCLGLMSRVASHAHLLVIIQHCAHPSRDALVLRKKRSALARKHRL